MIKKSLKNKALLFLLLTMSICTLFGGNAFLFNITNESADNDNTVLSVKKINRTVNPTDNDLTDGYEYVEHAYVYNPGFEEHNTYLIEDGNETIYDPLNTSDVYYYKDIDIINELASGDFTMLNNYDVDEALINETLTENTVENIHVSFGHSGYELAYLHTTVLLNDVPVNTLGTLYEYTNGTNNVVEFSQVIDFRTLYDLNNDPFTEHEGHYEYIFTYRYRDEYGAVSDPVNKSIDFWAINETTYLNTVGEDKIEPKMFNTEKIDRTITGGVERNYYNYNNYDLTDIYNPTASTELLMPTLTYDASKYNVSYTKTLYGVEQQITSTFEIVAPSVGEVNFYLGADTTPFKVDAVNELNGNYVYDGLVINDVADYNFTVSYIYKVADDNFILADTDFVYNASTRDNNVLLYNFGYQLYYSYNNTDEAEFKDLNNEIVTDYSHYNETFKTDYNYTTYPQDDTYTIPGGKTLAGTNQAPVFLKAYGSLIYSLDFTTSRSYYYYYPTGEKVGSPAPVLYTNNTRFTANGYYEVVVIYDFQKYDTPVTFVDQETNGSAIEHMQVFAFKVANKPPTVTIETDETIPELISSGNYTNQDVLVEWEVAGIFDVQPYAKLYRRAFDGYNPYTQPEEFSGAYDNVDGVVYDQNTPITENGHYILQVYYGPSTNTSIIYRFTIDKTPIENFNVYGVYSAIDEFDNVFYYTAEDGDFTGVTIINTPFTLNWDSKSSGALVTANYDFTSISKKDSFTPTLVDTGTETFITNGYETLNTYESLTYYKSNTAEDMPISANSVLTDSSIYEFYLTDQAGNTLVDILGDPISYYIILDNTDAEIIQDPESTSKYNYVPDTTTLTWGDFKAIEISVDSSLPTDLTDNTDLFIDNLGTTYLLIPIEQIDIYAVSLENSSDLEEADISPYLKRSFVKDVNFQTEVTFYTGYEETIPGGVEDLTGQNVYHTYLTDGSTINNQTNLSYENEIMLALTINLDRSQGYAETYGTVKGASDNEYRELALNNASNRQYLYFNYTDGTGDYEIASLVYDFYPLDFDLTSPNYPFASTPSLPNQDLMASANDEHAPKYISAPINTIYSTEYGDIVTMPGMYIVTRTYTGIIDEGTTGDTTVKYYTYYVDRYDIIELTSILDIEDENILVGEYIALLLGELPDRQAIMFGNQDDRNDFLISTTKDTLLESNLLPILLQIPQNKYSIYDSESRIYSGGITDLNLRISVVREYYDGSGKRHEETIDSLALIDGLYSYPDLYKNGIYTVIITDKAGYNQQLEGSNNFSFSFEIINDKPSGTFYGTPYNGQDISLVNINSTNDTDLKFVWQDPVDVYSAKIDLDNIKITQTLKNSSTETTIYQVIDGSEELNYNDLFSIDSAVIGQLVGASNTDRNEYTIQIFVSGDDLSLVEAEYKVYLQYEGSPAHYVYEDEDFYSNSLNIYVDRTSPEYNLNRLITTDSYLTVTEKDEVESLLSEINTENYAFAIDNSFRFFRNTDIDNSNQDTYAIYCRKYIKYAVGESNLQSFIPTDANYSNYEIQPTRPRFTIANPDYQLIGYDLNPLVEQVTGSFNGDYYEIIEIDEAGNYTIYTVQVFFFPTKIEGNKINEENFETITVPTDTETVDAINYEVTSIVTEDLWYTLTIAPTDAAMISLNHTPATIEEDFVAEINNILSTVSDEDNGAGFNVNLYTRVLGDINFMFNSQGNTIKPVFDEFEGYFTITLPTDTTSTHIETFNAYRAIAGVIDTSINYLQYSDKEGLVIDVGGASGAIYEFESGEYIFEFVDNFDRYYTEVYIFGVENIAEVFFDGPTSDIDNVTYTADNIKIVYQTELYDVVVTKNGDPYFISEIAKSYNDLTGIEEIVITDHAFEENLLLEEGGEQVLFNSYEIIFTNSAGTDSEPIIFNIYAYVPEIELTDSLGINLNHIIDYNTTKAVYIDYSDDELFPYTAGLRREVTDEFGQVTITNYTDVDPEFGYGEAGDYYLTLSNLIGLNITYEWTIRDTETIIFSVLADKPTGGIEVLKPSTTKYEYGDTSIDHYFTIYEPDIDLNPDRNLTLVEAETIIDAIGITTIYNLTGSFYEKTFAVTQVAIDTDFASGYFEINSVIEGGSSYKTIINPTVLSWQKFNLTAGNYVYVDYYFNGIYVGRTYNNELILEDAGIYHFEFSDFAGNKQMFGTDELYEIILVNEVIFSINDMTPIEDIIYNEPISLKVEHTGEYDYRTLSISATLNGELFTTLKVNDYYIFSEYGVYDITLSADVTVETEIEAQTIQARYAFTIANPNEAKITFDYNPQTGYEILSIMRGGKDATEEFKASSNSNTLTKLFLSEFEGGNGHYLITVQANYLTLKPSQTFFFEVWINNEDPIIQSSINEGSETTDDITLSFNKYLIYQQVGECNIVINGKDTILITEATSSINEVVNYQLSKNSTYLVQLQTATGNTVLSFKVIKKAPLNSTAIFVIIVAILIIGGLSFYFIRLRTKMKVS